MACKSYSLVGINTTCDPNAGGIREVFAIPKSDITVLEGDSTTGQITTLTLAQDKAFKTYKFRRGSSSFTSTLQTDPTVGNYSWLNEAALQFNRYDTAKRLELMALTLEETVVIVHDQNDIYYLMGYDNGVLASAGEVNSGAASTDFSGITVTLSDESREAPFIVPSSIIADLDIDPAPVQS